MTRAARIRSMSSSDWDQLWSLFDQALELASDQREAFVQSHCPEPLRDELIKLLTAHGGKSRILDASVESAVGDQEAADLHLDHVGDYRIVRLLGRGGMGEVYLGRRDDNEFHQDVAIKISPHGRYSPTLLQRFLVERQILSDLNHRHIARLFSGGTTEDGVPFLVMEYIDGLPIDEYCESHKLSLDDRLELFLKVCGAVHYAHQQLVVHLDIKPSNVMVDVQGTPRLLDFGVARLLDPDHIAAATTQSLGRLATPEYASPEQVRGETLSTASDIYSLGVLLYQLVTGHRPYDVDSRNMSDTVATICETEPVRPSEKAGGSRRLRRQLQGDIDVIVMKAMRKDPSRRYVSAEQLATDLQRHLEGLTILARPESLGYRSAKFFRRHPLGFAAGASFLVLLLAFAITATWQATRLQLALNAANLEKEKSTQVAEFLRDLFLVSDPWRQDQDTVSVRDLLDAGAERVKTDLAEQPEVQAAMMNTLGAVYGRLNEFDDAEAMARSAVEVYSTHLGTAHPSTIDAEVELGRILISRDRAQEALPIFERAMQQVLGLSQPNRILEAKVRLNYATNLRVLGQLDAALEQGREVLAIRTQVFGPDHELTSDALRDVAATLLNLGRLDESLELKERVHEIRQSLYGPSHPRTVDALMAIGDSHSEQGNYDDAEAIYVQVLEKRLETLGRFHTLTGATMNVLGIVQTRRGEYAKAEATLLDAIDVQRQVLGENSEKLGHSLTNLALVYNETERYDEALDLYAQSMRIDVETLGAGHPNVGIIHNNVGLIHQDKGDLDSAAESFQTAYGIFTKAWGFDHPLLGYSLNNLAIVLQDMGAFAQAEEKYKEALRVRTAGLAEDHPALAATLHEYARLLIDQGRFEQAMPMVDQALEIRQAKLAEGDWRTAHTRVLKGQLLAESGDLEQAEALMRDGLQRLKATRGPDHWRTRDVEKRLRQLSARAD